MVQADTENNNKSNLNQNCSNGSSSPASNSHTSPSSTGNNNIMASNSSNSTTPTSTSTPPHHTFNQSEDPPYFIERYPGSVCCLCNLCERTSMGQGKMLRLTVKMTEYRVAFKNCLEENISNNTANNTGNKTINLENSENQKSQRGSNNEGLYNSSSSNNGLNTIERKRNYGNSPRQKTIINNELINELDFIGYEEKPTCMDIMPLMITKIVTTSSISSLKTTPTTPTASAMKREGKESYSEIIISPSQCNKEISDSGKDKTTTDQRISLDNQSVKSESEISKATKTCNREKTNENIAEENNLLSKKYDEIVTELVYSDTNNIKDQNKSLGESSNDVMEREMIDQKRVDVHDDLKDNDNMNSLEFSNSNNDDDIDNKNGYIFIHTMCAMWTLQLKRIDEEQIVQQPNSYIKIETTLAQCLFRKCSFCQRYGASINCCMNCTKSYHLPCATAASCFQIFESFTTFCLEHLHQVPYIVMDTNIECRQCSNLGEISKLLMCSSCGAHYHTTCLGLANFPDSRAGWNCNQCCKCLICRNVDNNDGGGRTVKCEQCQKLYHTNCLRPIISSVPKYGWKCNRCRICSDCGARTPGAGSSSRWHCHYTICDSCYQQRNKGFSCPICHKAYRSVSHKEMVKCCHCNKFVHSNCDEEADLSSYHLKKEKNSEHDYICPPCKSGGGTIGGNGVVSGFGSNTFISSTASVSSSSSFSNLLLIEGQTILQTGEHGLPSTRGQIDLDMDCNDLRDNNNCKTIATTEFNNLLITETLKVPKKRINQKEIGRGGKMNKLLSGKNIASGSISNVLNPLNRKRTARGKARQFLPSNSSHFHYGGGALSSVSATNMLSVSQTSIGHHNINMVGATGGHTEHNLHDLNSSQGSEDDLALEKKIVLCSAKDKFILMQDICVMCGSLGRDKEACLIACVQCGQCYHPYCANVNLSKTMLQKGWRCLDCTVCEGCGQKNDEARLILCDECDISYHIYCMNPPLDAVPNGNWKCKWCAVCQKCGRNSPGKNSTWLNGFLECGPCASQTQCFVCSQNYNDNELIIQCINCERWLHGACDSIRSEEEAQIFNEIDYYCMICRLDHNMNGGYQQQQQQHYHPFQISNKNLFNDGNQKQATTASSQFPSFVNFKNTLNFNNNVSNKHYSGNGVSNVNGISVLNSSYDTITTSNVTAATSSVGNNLSTNSANEVSFDVSDNVFWIDGVCVNEHGFNMIRSLTTEIKRKRKMRSDATVATNTTSAATSSVGGSDTLNNHNVIVNNSCEGAVNFTTNAVGTTEEIPTPPTYKDGMVWFGEDGSQPEGFSISTNDEGVNILRKKRQRNLQKLGIGGFNVRARGIRKENNDEQHHQQHTCEQQSQQLFSNGGGELIQHIPETEKKKKLIRKKAKTKLSESYPAYLQEAFFGKSLLDNKETEIDFNGTESSDDDNLLMFKSSTISETTTNATITTTGNTTTATAAATMASIMINNENLQNNQYPAATIQMQHIQQQQSSPTNVNQMSALETNNKSLNTLLHKNSNNEKQLFQEELQMKHKLLAEQMQRIAVNVNESRQGTNNILNNPSAAVPNADNGVVSSTTMVSPADVLPLGAMTNEMLSTGNNHEVSNILMEGSSCNHLPQQQQQPFGTVKAPGPPQQLLSTKSISKTDFGMISGAGTTAMQAFIKKEPVASSTSIYLSSGAIGTQQQQHLNTHQLQQQHQHQQLLSPHTPQQQQQQQQILANLNDGQHQQQQHLHHQQQQSPTLVIGDQRLTYSSNYVVDHNVRNMTVSTTNSSSNINSGNIQHSVALQQQQSQQHLHSHNHPHQFMTPKTDENLMNQIKIERDVLMYNQGQPISVQVPTAAATAIGAVTSGPVTASPTIIATAVDRLTPVPVEKNLGKDTGSVTPGTQKTAEKMRKDEDLGEMATISAVLYANTQHPELKHLFPNWSERCKQILKKWRSLSTEMKAPFLQHAKDNRSVLRLRRSQQEPDKMYFQQKTLKEQEQERAWKQHQAKNKEAFTNKSIINKTNFITNYQQQSPQRPESITNVAVASTSLLAKQHLVQQQQQQSALPTGLQQQQHHHQQQQQLHQQQSIFDLSLLNDNNEKLQNALLRSEEAILGLNSGSTPATQLSATSVAQMNQQHQQQQHHNHHHQQQQQTHHITHPSQAQGQYLMSGGTIIGAGLRPSPPVGNSGLSNGSNNIMLNGNTNNSNSNNNNLITTALDHNNIVLASGVVSSTNIVMENYVKTENGNELSGATSSGRLDVGNMIGGIKNTNDENVQNNSPNNLHLLNERNDLYLTNKSWSTTTGGIGTTSGNINQQLPIKITGNEMKDVMTGGGNHMVVQVDKLVVESDENAGLGDILGGFGEGDDDEILKSLTAEIGDDFNILEYADPELDELNGETNILSQMDFDDNQRNI